MKQFKPMLICLILAGCGVEEINLQNNTSNSTNLLASNIFQIVSPDGEQAIDFKRIIDDNDVSFSLEPLNATQNKNCENFAITDEKISFSLNAGDYCTYQYELQNDQDTASATLDIYSSKALQPSLPPIEEVIILTDEANQTLSLNIAALMPLEGHTFDPSSVQIFGSGDNVGSIITNAQEIIYTAPELKQPGWNRIHYNLISQEQAASPVLGTIYISLLDSANPAPSISQPNYIHTSNYILDKSEQIKLDLTSLTGLEIQDDDGWEITNVFSYNSNATVAIDADTEGNKAFTFSATKLGEYKVTYIVADPLAAASIGHITIKVALEDIAATWSDVHLVLADQAHEKHEESYIAPPRYLVASQSYSVVPITDSSVNNVIAGFTLAQAKHYCQSRGEIPTVPQFENLLQMSTAANQWPKGQPYFARDDMGTPEDSSDDTFIAYDLTSKLTSAIDDRLYLTCVNSGKVTLVEETSTMVAGETPVHVFSITHELDASIHVNTTHSNGGEVETQIERLSYTESKINVSSTKVGSIELTVSSGSPSRALYPQLTFIGTVNVTPHIESLMIDSISYHKPVTNHLAEEVIADGKDSVLMKVAVTDKYQNAIAGQTITAAYKAEAPLETEPEESYAPFSSCSVDGNNSACITIEKTATDPYSFTISAQRGFTPLPRNVTFALTLNGNENEIGDAYPLRFIDAVCKDGYNSDAAGKCLKVLELDRANNTYLFTAPPSISFYDYARSFYQGELLPEAVEYKDGTIDRTALLINNDISLGSYGDSVNFSNVEYGDIFTDEDNFVVFRGVPLVQYQERYQPSEAWCGVLNTINFMGINTWQMLNHTAEGTDHFVNYTTIPPENLQAPLYEDDIQHHILYKKHGWYLRAHDQMAWYKGTVADTGEPVSGSTYTSYPVGIMKISRGFVNDEARTGGPGEYGHGHSICQAKIAASS